MAKLKCDGLILAFSAFSRKNDKNEVVVEEEEEEEKEGKQ